MTTREIVITAANTVELQESPLEEKLCDYDVLIQTEASYISAGTELANYTGIEPATRVPGSWCCYPWKPGYANVGTVLQTGKSVTRVKEGDRVFSFGKHASHVVIDTSASHAALVLPVPGELATHRAVASRMAGVAYTAAHVAERSINRWVCVYGLGAVGNLAAQIFRIMGCRVIGIDPSPHRRDLALTCDIPNVLGGSNDEVLAGIRELTGGTMAQTAVDAVGDSRVILQCLKSVGTLGEVILLGTPRAEVQGNITEGYAHAHRYSITIKGAHEWVLDTYPTQWSGTTLHDKQVTLFDWVMRGQLHVDPLVSHIIRPEQMGQGYEGLLREKDVYVGVIVDWT